MKDPIVRLRDATVRLAPEGGEKAILLDQIHIDIFPGDWIHMAGPNGSGKSTLAKVVTGHAELIAGGSAILSGVCQTAFGGRTKVPYVTQDPEASIIGTTPMEDLLLAAEMSELAGEHLVHEIRGKLEFFRLWERREQPVELLSGGQKQLLAAASCLLGHIPLLVLDEAAAMLDAEARTLLLDGVRRLNEAGTAVLWISHRLEDVRPGDRIAAMERGKLVYDGGADQFFQRVENGVSVCEKLGYQLPFAVETALELQRRGLFKQDEPLPLTIDALTKAVNAQ